MSKHIVPLEHWSDSCWKWASIHLCRYCTKN